MAEITAECLFVRLFDARSRVKSELSRSVYGPWKIPLNLQDDPFQRISAVLVRERISGWNVLVFRRLREIAHLISISIEFLLQFCGYFCKLQVPYIIVLIVVLRFQKCFYKCVIICKFLLNWFIKFDLEIIYINACSSLLIIFHERTDRARLLPSWPEVRLSFNLRSWSISPELYRFVSSL